MRVTRRWAIVVVLALAACSAGGGDDAADEGTRLGPLDGMHHDLGWETTLVGIVAWSGRTRRTPRS